MTDPRQFARETYGRALAGLTDQSPEYLLRAYRQAMGDENARLANFVEQAPPVVVRRGDQWVDPDEGIDVRDFTTDLAGDIPSMVGGGLRQ